MSDDKSVIKSISWRDLCPWTIIFRAFALAVNPSVILLATAGVALSCVAWKIPEYIFKESLMGKVSDTVKDDSEDGEDAEETEAAESETNFEETLQNVMEKQANAQRSAALRSVVKANSSTYRRSNPVFEGGFADPMSGMSLSGRNGIPGVYWDYTDSFYYLFDYESSQHLTWGQRMQIFAYFAFGGLFSIAIWSITAGAITRIAVLRLARDETCSLTAAVKFSLSRFMAYFAAPLMPLAFIVAIGLIVGVFALFMQAGWGVVLVGIFWLLILLAGFLMAFLLVGLMFGWPLMFPTISAESSDSFDAISRSYAYVLQRPFTYAFYLLMAVFFGGVCWWMANLFGEQVIAMADWSVSWGAGSDRVTRIHELINGAEATESEGSLAVGANIIGFFNGFLRTAITGFTYGLFWCMASAIYLLMRKKVDDTEMDEVFVEGEDDYGLPPLSNEPSETSEPKKEAAADASTEPAKKDDSNTTDKNESKDKKS